MKTVIRTRIMVTAAVILWLVFSAPSPEAQPASAKGGEEAPGDSGAVPPSEGGSSAASGASEGQRNESPVSTRTAARTADGGGGILGPGFGVARRNREGNRLYEDQDWEGAMGAYTDAQVLAPDLPELSYNLGNVLYQKGQFEQAADELHQVAGEAEGDLAADALHNLGNSLFRMGQYKEAVDAYLDALNRRPGDADTKRNLEMALRRMNRQQQQQSKNDDADKKKDSDKKDGGSQQKPGESGEQQDDQDRSQEKGESGDQQQEKDQQQGKDREQSGKTSDDEQKSPQDQGDRGDAGEQQQGRNEAGQDEKAGENPSPGQPGNTEGGSGESRREGARFTEKEAARLLDALSGDEREALRRLMKGKKASSANPREDW